MNETLSLSNFILGILGALMGGAGVYAGVRADIAALRATDSAQGEAIKMAHNSALAAHARMDAIFHPRVKE